MRTEYRIERVSEDVYNQRLDEFQYSLFITPEWVTSMCDDEVHPIFLNIVHHHSIEGKIAGLVFNSQGLKGKQYYFYAGPATKNNQPQVYCNMVSALIEYASRHQIAKLIIKSYDQQHSFFCSDKRLKTTERCEYVYHFDTPNESSSHKSFMKNVKKAQKVNAVITEDNTQESLNKLIELLTITHQLRNPKHEGTYKEFPYFRVNAHSLKKVLESGLGKQYVVSVDGVVHCVNFLLIRDGKIFGLIIGSDQYAYDHSFHHFVKYTLMNKFAETAQYYNLASAEPGTGLANFRVSMGFQEHFVYGSYSNFLVYPQKMLNPIIQASRSLNSNRLVSYLQTRTSSLFAHQEIIGE